MTEISAAFKLIDEMSDGLEEIADSAEGLENTLEEISGNATNAFTNMEESADSVAETIESVASSVSVLEDSIDEATSGMNEFSDVVQEMGDAVNESADSIENVEEATVESAEAFDDMGERGSNAFRNVVNTIEAVGIIAVIKELRSEIVGMSDEFDESQALIVKGTGATGEALDSLMDSSVRVFAETNADSINEISDAVAELNTRFGLTGPEMERVALLFDTFSDATGAGMKQSITSTSKLMKQWNADLSELPDILDQLVYSSQASGAAVQTLTMQATENASTFKLAGMTLENSIGFLADMEAAGINTAKSVLGLKTAVSGFNSQGIDAREGLTDVITKIREMESETEAAALATSTFGMQVGQQFATAIRNGKIDIETFSETLEEAKGTMDMTAETAETASEKWAQATNSISSAFQQELAPGVNEVSSAFAGIVSNVGEWLHENPEIVKGITAVGVGIGAVVTGVAAYTAAVKIATVVQTTLAATNPFGLILTAVTALTAGLVALSIAFGESKDVLDEFTVSEKEHQEQLAVLNEQYEEAVERYGDDSDAALQLKYQIDELNRSYEDNYETLRDLVKELDEYKDAVDGIENTYKNNTSAIHDQYLESLSLMTTLENLAGKQNLTSQEQEIARMAIDELNATYSDLDLTYEGFIEDQEKSVETIRRVAQEWAEAQLQQEEYVRYLELTKEQMKHQEAYDAAIEERTAAQEAFNDAEKAYQEELAKYQELAQQGIMADTYAMNQALEVRDEAYEKMLAVNDATQEAVGLYEQNAEELKNMESGYEDVSEAAEESATVQKTGAEEVKEGLEAQETEILALATAYENAYQAAKSSFDGQFGLFDEAQANAEATVEAAQTALDTQLTYWETYKSNIETIQGLGADALGLSQEQYDALMAEISSGSEQSAGLAQSIVDNIEAGNTEAVTALGETIEEVASTRDQIASEMAEWETNFTEQLANIVASMDLSASAKSAASTTISAYLEELGSDNNLTGIQNNAKAITSGVISELSSRDAEAKTAGTTTVENYLEGISGCEELATATAELIAQAVIEGLFGNGETRQENLGELWGPVQAYVDSIKAGDEPAQEAAKQILADTLTALGSTEGMDSTAQSVVDNYGNNLYTYAYLATQNASLVAGEVGTALSEIPDTLDPSALMQAFAEGILGNASIVGNAAEQAIYEEWINKLLEQQAGLETGYNNAMSARAEAQASYDEVWAQYNAVKDIINNPDNYSDAEYGEAAAQCSKIITGVAEAGTKLAEVTEETEGIIQQYDSVTTSIQELQEKMDAVDGSPVANNIQEAVEEGTDGVVVSIENMNSEMNSTMEANHPLLYNEGTYMIDEISRGFNSQKSSFLLDIQNLATEATNTFNNSFNPNTSLGSGTVPGHADGTTDAEDVFIAGEEGPELIVGKGGSTVFPTGETNKILGAINDRGGGRSGSQRFTIEIAGSGSIGVDRNTDVNSVVSILQENIKPVLMRIIKQEIFEEGRYSYDF